MSDEVTQENDGGQDGAPRASTPMPDGLAKKEGGPGWSFAEAAERLGVTKAAVRKMHAEVIRRWPALAKKEGAGPAITDGAMAVLVQELAGEDADPEQVEAVAFEELPHDAGVANGVPIAEMFWVKKIPLNARVLLVTRDRELAGEPVRVQVRSSANYAVGRPLLAVPVRGTGAAVWRCVSRAPRFKGENQRLVVSKH